MEMHPWKGAKQHAFQQIVSSIKKYKSISPNSLFQLFRMFNILFDTDNRTEKNTDGFYFESDDTIRSGKF